MEIIKNNSNIDFVAKKNVAISASLIVVVLTIIGIFAIGFNYGIDFRGGIEVQVGFKAPLHIDEVRKRIEKINIPNANVVQFENSSDFTISAEGGANEAEIEKNRNAIEASLKTEFANDGIDVKRVDVVGPKAGSQLKLSAIKSVLYSILFLLIYLGFRFDFKFSVGAVFATLHDVMFILAAYIVFHKEFSLSSIAAILTVIGYSMNDTVIVFDRIRENEERLSHLDIVGIINASINQTLSRTILTATTTFLVTLCLFVFGGGVIRDFAFAMLIGIVVGTYSSIFIASPILIYLENWGKKKNAGPTTGLNLKPKNA